MSEHGSMKLALKRFNSPSNPTKSLIKVDKNLGTRFYISNRNEATPWSNKEIQQGMISGEDPSNHLQMITWNQRLPQSIHNMHLKHFLLLAQIVKKKRGSSNPPLRRVVKTLCCCTDSLWIHCLLMFWLQGLELPLFFKKRKKNLDKVHC